MNLKPEVKQWCCYYDVYVMVMSMMFVLLMFVLLIMMMSMVVLYVSIEL